MLCSKLVLKNRNDFSPKKDTQKKECASKQEVASMSEFKIPIIRKVWSARTFQPCDDTPRLNVITIELPNDAKTLVVPKNAKRLLKRPRMKSGSLKTNGDFDKEIKRRSLSAGPVMGLEPVKVTKTLELMLPYQAQCLTVKDSPDSLTERTDDLESNRTVDFIRKNFIGEIDDGLYHGSTLSPEPNAFQEPEIHPDIQELLERSAMYEAQLLREQERHYQEFGEDNECEVEVGRSAKKREKRRRKKKHRKHKRIEELEDSSFEEEGESVSRHMRRMVTLSRPPSPETVQVIRVDVTSNQSINDFSDDSLEFDKPVTSKLNEIKKSCEMEMPEIDVMHYEKDDLKINCLKASIWNKKT